MAKRRKNAGRRAGKTDAPTKRDVSDWDRLARKAGGPDKVPQWIGERILPEIPREDFDNFVLSGVAFMEDTTWKYQRAPDAKSLLKDGRIKRGEPVKAITRQDYVCAIVAGIGEEVIVNAAGEKQKVWRRKDLGASNDAVIKRIIHKDRARGGKYKARN
jgi:hypothetical protein